MPKQGPRGLTSRKDEKVERCTKAASQLHQDLMHQNMKEVRNKIEEMKLGLMKTNAKLEIAIEAKVLDAVGKSGTQSE